jgi:phospholipid transport system substrate-binding protein
MRVRGGFLAFCLGVSLWGEEVCAQPRGGPTAWIQLRHAAVQQLLQQPASPARDGQVGRLLHGMIDVDELARRSLDTYWDARTPAERQEYTQLLRGLIDRSYRQNLQDTLGWGVTYEAETVAPGAQEATVRSVARSRTDPRAAPVRIEYRLRRGAGGQWVIWDLVTNGSSTVQTYRESYTRIVRERGFDELLRRLRARAAQS